MQQRTQESPNRGHVQSSKPKGQGPYVTRVTLKATQARGPTPPHGPGNGADEPLMNCSAVRRPPPKIGLRMSSGISERASLSAAGTCGAGTRAMLMLQ